VEISLDVVKKVFLDILDGRVTREMADRWAYSVIQESELGTLIFVPPEEMGRIWDGVMYLYGIDIIEATGEYLHTEQDIRIAMQEKVCDGHSNFILG